MELKQSELNDLFSEGEFVTDEGITLTEVEKRIISTTAWVAI